MEEREERMGRQRSGLQTFLQTGLPFLSLVVGTAYGLSLFVGEGNEMRDRQRKVTVTEQELKRQQTNREPFDEVKEYRVRMILLAVLMVDMMMMMMMMMMTCDDEDDF